MSNFSSLYPISRLSKKYLFLNQNSVFDAHGESSMFHINNIDEI